MNSTTKLGKIISVIVLGAVAILFLVGNISGVKVKFEDTSLSVDALFFKQVINYNDMANAEIQTDFQFGSRTIGTDFIGLKNGNFTNSTFGNYRVAVVTSQKDVIVITKTNGEHFVFNVKDSAKLNDILSEIKSHINN